MKTSRLLFGFLSGISFSLSAQEPAPAAVPAPAPTVVAPAPGPTTLASSSGDTAMAPGTEGGTVNAATPFTAEQLDQLVGPIALYPDALIALILPASTSLGDLVLAARYVQGGGDLSQVEHRAWEVSVKSLTHYPEVLKWLDANLDWTKQLGEAFAAQPAEVMNAIQRLRAKAQANGALTDTPQQQVLVEQSEIRIVPAQPDVIYVPTYDPTIVYLDRPIFYSYGAPALRFGPPCRVGSWLAFEFNWSSRSLWVGDRYRRWPDHHDWHRPLVPVAPVVTIPGGPPTHLRPSRPWSPPRPQAVAWSTPIHRAWQAPDTHSVPGSRSIRPRPAPGYAPPSVPAHFAPPQTIVRATPPPIPDTSAVTSAPAFRRREFNDARGWDSGRRASHPGIGASGPTATVLPSAPSVSYTSPPPAMPRPAPEPQARVFHGPRGGFSAPSPAQAPVAPPAMHLPPPSAPQYTPPPAVRAPTPPPSSNSDSGSRPAPQDPDGRRRDRRHID